MATKTDRFQPDYAVSPGWVLAERLEANGISQAELARRCGRSPKLISEIIAGKAPVEAETALQFEKVLGVDAGIWLGLETDYRLHQLRQAEAREAEASAEWAQSFPVNLLAKRGAIRKVSSAGERVTELLTFFGVASIEAWTARNETVAVAYRHSPTFESNSYALAAWLRMAEIKAERQTSKDYDRAAFMRALKKTPSSDSRRTATGPRRSASTLRRCRRRSCLGRTPAQGAPERGRQVAFPPQAADRAERAPRVRRSNMVQPVPRGRAHPSAQQEECFR